MSKPASSSVTPKIDKISTPNLSPCNVPYRWLLHVGRCVSVHFGQSQPEAVWGSHQHFDVQVLYFGEGADCTVHWEQDGKWTSRDVREPLIWVIGVGMLHKLEWRRSTLHAVFYVQSAFVAEFAGLEIQCSSFFHLETAGRCDSKIPELLKEFEQMEQPHTAAESVRIESLASLAAIHLFQSWHCLTAPAEGWTATLGSEALGKIDAFIDRRIDQKILMADMAREVGMSESNFARLFKRKTGMTPGRYLIEKRIQKSKTLLVAEDCRIGEVALAVGFSSQGHFDLFFKRQSGMTPREYRAFHYIRRDL